MECDVCDKKIRRKKAHDGNYSHFYYIDDNTYYHEYEDYDKSPHLTGKKSKDDVMVCSKCHIKNKNIDEISRKEYIPKEQFRNFVILKLKKGEK